MWDDYLITKLISWKRSRIKRGMRNQIRCTSLKNYSANIYDEALSRLDLSWYIYKEILGRLDFLNYHKFENIKDAYSNLIQKAMEVIDLVATIKSKRIKQNSQEWFEGEVAEKMSVHDKFFKKFKKSKMQKLMS